MNVSKLLSAAVAATLVSVMPVPQVAAAVPVELGQSLTKLEIPGRISAVLWTRRADSYTLQVKRRLAPEGGYGLQAPRASTATTPAASVAERQAAEAAGLQVWLLRADGSAITPTKRRRPSSTEQLSCTNGRGRCLGDEFLFAFAPGDGAAAVAAVLRSGDVYLVEKLERFPD